MDNHSNLHVDVESLPQPAVSSGCGTTVLYLAAVAWIILLGFTTQSIAWTLEQAIFEGSLPVPDLRWLVPLVFGLLVFLPFLGLSTILKNSVQKNHFRAFSLAGLLSLLLVPARLPGVSAAQLTQWIQIMGIVVFIGVMWIFFIRNEKSGLLFSPSGSLPAAASISALSAIPWIWVGALGSGMDILLAILHSLLVGLASAIILDQWVLGNENRDNSPKPGAGRILRDGLISSLVLFIISTAVGQNGNQWILAMVLPAAGWCVPILGQMSRQKAGTSSLLPLALFTGFTLIWPALWLDADELNLVITVGTGELFSWAVKGAMLHTAILVISAFLLIVFRNAFEKKSAGRIQWAFILVVGILAGLFYATLGRPGLYGEKLFVVLKSQLDPAEYSSIQNPVERRQAAYKALTRHAGQTQQKLRSTLEQFGISYTPYYLVNALEVRGGPLLAAYLRTRPEVDRVLSSPHLRPLPEKLPAARGEASAPNAPEWNLTMIGANRAWDLGITGKGIVIGQSDSGVQGDHPELLDSYRGRNGDNHFNWLDPWFGSRFPTDIGGHGTHTLGSILGNSTGVAPDAEWIGCVNLARNLGNPALYMDCWQFMLAPYPQDGNPFQDGRPELGAQILNNSWGCPNVEGCDPQVFLPAAHALRAAGVFVVVSTGNSGYRGCSSVDDTPAIYDDVFSVGAVNQDGMITEFSSLGPVSVDGSGRTKPDIAAPGEEILSAYPGSTYSMASGTSMAGPHVAGVVALMWSANPELIGNIDLTEDILQRSAQAYTKGYPPCVDANSLPNNGTGYGIVDAFAAVLLSLEKKP